MKKIIPLILIVFLLVSCSPAEAGQQSDTDMATRVAQLLTEMPSSEGVPTATRLVLATQPPVVEVTLPPTATLLPSDTPVPTETLEPTATEEPATETPEPGSGTVTPPPTLTSPAQPTFTPPAGDPRAKLGTPTSTDSMDNATQWVWPTGQNDFTGIAFKNGYLQLTGLTKDAGWRLPLVDSSANMYIEMVANPKTCSGRDNYGIIFRVPDFHTATQGYLFGVSCSGEYALWKWDGTIAPDGKAIIFLAWKKNSAIQAGVNNINRLGVWTSGNRILLYANGALLGEYSDASYKQGSFGVFVNPDATEDFTVRIDEMSYWLNVSP